MSKKIKTILLIGIVVVALGFLPSLVKEGQGVVVVEEQVSQPAENFRGEPDNILSGNTLPEKTPTEAANTTLEISGKKYAGEVSSPVSVYKFMETLRREGKINFTDKTYIGMGKMIVALNGIKSSGAYTWIYYVNGTEAEIGVSNYIINPGDVVSWKYEKVHY